MKKKSIILRYIRETDKVLLLLCLIASAFSILCLMGIANTFSSITRPMKMQVLASVIGVGVALIISSIDYHSLAALWKIHMPLSVLLVLATLIFGMQRDGADDKAWLMLPGGLSIQPSEILKLSFVLTFALHLSLVQHTVNRLSTLALLCLHGAVPVLLIHIQGDDGTAMVFAFIFICMLFTLPPRLGRSRFLPRSPGLKYSITTKNSGFWYCSIPAAMRQWKHSSCSVGLLSVRVKLLVLDCFPENTSMYRRCTTTLSFPLLATRSGFLAVSGRFCCSFWLLCAC